MIYEFNEHIIPPLNKIGGKAKGLMESTQAGFPVPEGLVLSVDFFQEWLEAIKSSPEWQSFLAEGTKEKCDQITNAIKKLKFSVAQSEELYKHLANLSGDVFSTRSSSPEEDLDGTSFAGMYETYLSVKRGDIKSYVLKTFASCFDYRVMGYKRQCNISLDNTAIAVVIQRQIDSDVSGIAFSLNPLSNAFDEVMINASFGLGEAIVSGIVTPDTYIVDKVTSSITDKIVNSKDIAIRSAENGSVQQVNNRFPTEQALKDEQILELSNLVCRIEEHYGKPMDTEWAIESGVLFLLQARPITTNNPLFPEMVTKPSENKELYMDFIAVTQGFSDPMSDLGLDIWAKMVHIGNGLPVGKGGIMWAIHGRHYLSMSHLMRVSPAMLKTFSSHDEPTKKIFAKLDTKPFTQGKKPESLKGFMWDLAKYMLPMYAGSSIKGMLNPQSALLDYQAKSEKVERFLHSKLMSSDKSFSDSVNESLDGFAELVKEVGGVLIAASFAKWRIECLFKGHDEAKDLIVCLAMNLPNNPVAEMGKLMLKLASYPEFIATSSAQEFQAKLITGDYSDEFTHTYNDYITRFGCRGVKEIDIATPRMSENLEHIYGTLKLINIEDNATTKTQQRSKDAYDKLLHLASTMGKGKKFEKLAKTYRDMIGFRDHPKYMYVVAVGLLRQKALQLGTQWALSGRIKEAEDIFSLSLNDISEGETNDDFELTSIIDRNQKALKDVSHVKDWPSLVDSRGKYYTYVPEAKEGEIVGEVISPGFIKGRAKVLLDPYEKTLEKGEILVCKASEPSWAPIFINASGVIMEVGGPLQHGAIIAREYGLPCVSSVHNATKAIKDGDLIELDASIGIVRIVTE